MSAVTESEILAAKSVLKTFSTYGFQKTSMQDIATASGVSRQSIYKKFGSKEKCYEFVIEVYLLDMYTRIFSTLDGVKLPPKQILQQVFNTFIGDAIEVVSNPHGTEVFDDCLHATHSSKEDWPLRFKARLAAFLEKNGLASSDNAKGVAFALISAGKGLLLEEATREKFNQDMEIIINSVIAN